MFITPLLVDVVAAKDEDEAIVDDCYEAATDTSDDAVAVEMRATMTALTQPNRIL